MKSAFDDSILSAEQVAHLLTNASSKVDKSDYASAQIMVGVAQSILNDLQTELDRLKNSLEQYSKMERMLRTTVVETGEKK